MTRKELGSALRKQTENVRVSPQLRQKTLDAIYGKENTIMRRKIPVILLAAVLSMLFCAAALAAAGLTGMIDYQRLYSGAHIPENASDSIETDVLKTGGDPVAVSVRELYYDGKTVRLTVDVTPRDDGLFLAALDTLGTDAWAGLNWLNPQFDENDSRTVAEAFTEGDYSASYIMSVGLNAPEENALGGSVDYSYTAPNVVTFFYEEHFADDRPEREVELSVSLVPFIDREGKQIEWTPEQRIRLVHPLTLSSSVPEETAYVSAGPVSFPETGVTIEQLQVIPKPHELLVRIYYTIGDSEAGNQPAFGNAEMYGLVKEYFQLEFIDPDSSAEEPHNQRLADGPSGCIESRRLSEEGEAPIRMLYEFALGLNELHDEYTVRVFDYSAKTRYDSVTIPVREATEADLAAFPAK